KSNIETKMQIASKFMELVEERPPSKRVSITELTSALKINRVTFYNHFDNIDMLVQWIYRNSTGEILFADAFKQYTLVKPSPELNDPWPDLPIYVQADIEGNFEAQALFFKSLGKCHEKHRAYYEKIFSGHIYFDLFDYVVELYLPAIRQDIIVMLKGREMPESVINFLAEYHTMGIFGRVRYHYAKTHSYMLQEDLSPYFMYGHNMLEYTIENYSQAEEIKGLRNLFKFKGRR
ncbi:MAG: hypothetical protein RR822_04855, partial [Raoultibacter sp.]